MMFGEMGLLVGQHGLGAVTEYNANTATTIQSLHAGTSVPTFASPSTALGLLLVPTTQGVTAFK